MGCHAPPLGDLPDPGDQSVSPALAGDFFNTAQPGRPIGFSLVFACLVVGLRLPERAPDVGCWLQVFLRQPVQKPVGDSLHQPLPSTLPPTSFLPPSFRLPPPLPPTVSCLPLPFAPSIYLSSDPFLSILSFPSWALAQEGRRDRGTSLPWRSLVG